MCIKAENMINALKRIMPKSKGFREKKRRVIATAVLSAMVYGAPVRGKVTEEKMVRRKLDGAGRKLAIDTVSAYRTVSAMAVQAIASIPPIDLAVKERMEIHEAGEKGKIEAKNRLYVKWQER
ncbi:uncharacterized protein LOC105701412 [Orussus abietinus]|uniref:uncharacterized protein LOC105701412 n=1 Tax=Orussus abietinus TaxID=222816 RepID=UPI0006256B93|nr:uncharacterized protein LOC105701412 [Orussus abietinus]